MATTLDFEKAPADKRVTVWIGAKGSIADFDKPTAAEINAMHMASDSISWNDFDFGMQASETNNDPSLADSSSYETRGQANFGGNISYYYPKKYNDPSNPHSVVYDMTKTPGTHLEIVVRVDGDVKTSAPAADGDFVSVYDIITDSETNSLQGADALRRTVNHLQQSAFAHRVVVGGGALVVTLLGDVTTEGGVGRLRVTQAGRDITGACEFGSSSTAVAVSSGGGLKRIAAGAADITIAAPDGTEATESLA